VVTSGSMTLRRRRLGSQLRSLRERAGLPLEIAAERLDMTASRASRIETGNIAVGVVEVTRMVTLYGLVDDDIAGFRQRAREASRTDAWCLPEPDFSNAYAQFEEAASQVRIYAAQSIPALLRTGGYARHLLDVTSPQLTAAQVSARLGMIERRQGALDGADVLDLRVVIDETVLRRAVGGPGEMKDQLAKLATMATSSHVTIHILPQATGAHPGVDGSFAIIDGGDSARPGCAVVEGAGVGLFFEHDRDVHRYETLFDGLTEVALSPGDTLDLLQAAANR
jgi:transcriptional regulator with XRE-family HTH domain